MITFLFWMASIVIAVLAFVFVIGFTHAFTARMTTGKWPHQSDEAKGIYDALNNATKGASHDQR